MGLEMYNVLVSILGRDMTLVEVTKKNYQS